MADANIVIIGGAADDQDHDIPDNTDPAWRVHQGATDYIAVDTTDRAESVRLVSGGAGKAGIGAEAPVELLHLASNPMRSLGRLDTGVIATKVTLATPADIVNFFDGMEVVFSSDASGSTSPATTTISNTDKDPASGDYGTFDVVDTTDIAPQDYCTTVKEDAYIKFTTEGGGHGASDGAHIGLNSTGTFYIQLDDANDFFIVQGSWPPKLTINSSGNVALAAGLNVANTGALGTSSVAIGEGCTAAGANAISAGYNARAGNTKSVAIGNGAQSNQSGGIAIGGSCKTNAGNSIAIASNSAETVSGADNSIAFGYYSQAMQPFETTFSNVPYVEDRKGCAQRKFVSGQCQTTNDDVTAMLDSKSGGAANGAIALVVNTTNAYQTDSGASDYYSNTALFRIRMISSVTSAGSSFAVGDFLCREYNLAIKWFYSTSASTIELISDAAGTVIGSNSSQNTTLYSSRENVRATSAIAHETTGIIDSIELTTANSAQRGSWNLKVKSGDSSATIRHSCFIDQVDHLLI